MVCIMIAITISFYLFYKLFNPANFRKTFLMDIFGTYIDRSVEVQTCAVVVSTLGKTSYS